MENIDRTNNKNNNRHYKIAYDNNINQQINKE